MSNTFRVWCVYVRVGIFVKRMVFLGTYVTVMAPVTGLIAPLFNQAVHIHEFIWINARVYRQCRLSHRNSYPQNKTVGSGMLSIMHAHMSRNRGIREVHRCTDLDTLAIALQPWIETETETEYVEALDRTLHSEGKVPLGVFCCRQAIFSD